MYSSFSISSLSKLFPLGVYILKQTLLLSAAFIQLPNLPSLPFRIIPFVWWVQILNLKIITMSLKKKFILSTNLLFFLSLSFSGFFFFNQCFPVFGFCSYCSNLLLYFRINRFVELVIYIRKQRCLNDLSLILAYITRWNI